MNKLATEKSPYLLQHKENPVDWYPWGEEAFEKARDENKPVFLSIGYATCHWCHVMAHESFEDEEIAALLNETYVSIKVDREERPDIDSTYMTVCQMLNGHGGWPLTIVMTPEKEPFFAGTYIPKEARFQRIGLRQLLPGIKGMWTHEPAKVRKAVESIKDGFARSLEFEQGPFPGTEAIDFASEQLMMRYDEELGGFGSAPKFPTPHNLMFLLREWAFKNEPRFKEAVVHTLQAMRLGGIWDHIGFGFHRYSTDRHWLLPHFEKMLYDQALLMMAYTEGWQVSGDLLFRQTVEEIAAYVFRDLMHSDGAFFSAEDADSEGEEGRFYVWDEKDIDDVLSDSQAKWFKELFRFSSDGNFEDEATKAKTGKNIPHLASVPNADQSSKFEAVRQQLFDHRSQRVRPELDDKILTDWNALMIAALAKAGAAFGNEVYLNAARKAYDFIRQHLVIEDQLLHRFKDGEAAIDAFADDYAFLIWAAIELFEATSESTYLQDALNWNERFVEALWDEEDGAFYFSGYEQDQPLGKQKQIYDGAIPSSNSVAMLNLIRLGRLTGQSSLEEMANRIGSHFSADLIRSGSSTTLGMQSIQFLNYDPTEIVVALNNKQDRELLSDLMRRFLPHSVIVSHSPEDEQLRQLCPYLEHQLPMDGRTTFYLCRNYSCDNLVYDPAALEKLLQK